MADFLECHCTAKGNQTTQITGVFILYKNCPLLKDKKFPQFLFGEKIVQHLALRDHEMEIGAIRGLTKIGRLKQKMI